VAWNLLDPIRPITACSKTPRESSHRHRVEITLSRRDRHSVQRESRAQSVTGGRPGAIAMLPLMCRMPLKDHRCFARRQNGVADNRSLPEPRVDGSGVTAAAHESPSRPALHKRRRYELSTRKPMGANTWTAFVLGSQVQVHAALKRPTSGSQYLDARRFTLAIDGIVRCIGTEEECERRLVVLALTTITPIRKGAGAVGVVDTLRLGTSQAAVR